MPHWINLPTIAAAITVIAIISDVLKLFPRFAQFRRPFSLLSFGFLLGSLLTAITGLRIDLAQVGSPLFILMVVCVVLTLLFVFLAVMSETPERKFELYGVAAFFVVGLIFFMAVYSTTGTSYSNVGITDLTFREEMALADRAQQLNDPERALTFLEAADSSVGDDDPRKPLMAKRIATAKQALLKNNLEATNSL